MNHRCLKYISSWRTEKIIQERTGRRSIKALRMYEQATTSQHVAVSNIL